MAPLSDGQTVGPLFCPSVAGSRPVRHLEGQAVYPGLQFAVGQLAIEQPPFQDLGFGGYAALEAGDGLAKAAAAGSGKQHNGFAGKVVAFQKAVDDGGATYHQMGKPRKTTS